MARFNGATLPERRRLAKAEVWLLLAVRAGQYAKEITEPTQHGMIPVEEWPRDDPWVTLMRTYGLPAHEIGKILDGIADGLESRADIAGYDETWDAVD